MADNESKHGYGSELYTISLCEQSEKGEKIPERIFPPAKVNTSEKAGSKQEETPTVLSKVQKVFDYFEKQGKPPVLTTAAILAKQAYFKPQDTKNLNVKSFIELARDYVDATHEKTEHVPFMSYWPSYEYMSRKQLNWYFYMRSRIRAGDYIETDLSYLFLYIYELINQIGVNSPEDGLEKMISVWINYRRVYSRLDRYLADWTGDYINFYKCGAEQTFETLKKEGLFLLMPTNMLADYYFRNNLKMPFELITRFSDYKLYESGFVKGENGNLFIDSLPDAVHKIRCRMNKEKDGSFEKRESLLLNSRLYKKFPFQRSNFNNPDCIRVETYLPYETFKPFRSFITAVIKEFENQLRILTKYKGRLRPDALPEEAASICKACAQTAFSGSQTEQKTEITIDREKLLALIQDSDEVRKKLIEGNDEYGHANENDYKYDGETMNTESVENIGQPVPEATDNAVLCENGGTLKSYLTPVQREVLDYLLSKGGSSAAAEINSAFPGVFIGVEIDKINDSALDNIGDLLVGFEDERWYIMEEYMNDI